MMKKLFFMLLIIISFLIAHEYNPVADKKATVISGNARFTVLTDGVIRMEWTEDGIFEDHASLVFVNRNLPVPKYKQNIKNGWLSIQTDKFLLNYKIGSEKFTNDNLKIEFDFDGNKKTWKPGTKNENNLLGTIRTLDGFDGEIMNWSTKEKIKLNPGILSRDGWVVIDDSERPIFDNSDWQWVKPKPEKNQQDLYFFCYGYDYKGALKDYTKIAGNIALPPRFAFGAWWSRYWEYTDLEMRELIDEFEIHDVPIDVLVVDMDWHITTKPEWYKDGKKIKDQAGEGIGWTGFTWNHNYFPNPQEFLQWTETKGLKVCMNLHPASGIQPHEKKYPEMAKAMGVDPKSEKFIPFDIVNKDFANNFMKTILHPMEEDGVDFWWLDWQQWSTTNISGVNPTFYLNYVFFSDMERRNTKRPLIFHRFGGLGNHRYQIGFSGDTFINWQSLDYQPYFTSTAANVGFGFWSHDIGGHMAGESTPELYTRWVQFGAFSPILRTHCTKADYVGGIERRIWAYPLENFYAMRDVFHLRYALIPYIYTAAREAYDTGISLCRPMYYNSPKVDEAYKYRNQYMFGNDLLLAPITEPIEENSLFVKKKIWLPEGEWIEWYSGELTKGGRVISEDFTIDEIPIFVKSGAIIPMQPKMKNSREKPVNPLILNIFPGKSGTTEIYNDEGNTNNYKTDNYSITNVHFNKKDKSKIEIVIEPIKGNFPGMLKSRKYEIRLPLTFPPKSVKVNGRSIDYQKNGGERSWNYCGNELATYIFTKEFSIHQRVTIKISFPESDQNLLFGKIGKFHKLMKFTKFLARNNWDKSKYSNDLVVSTTQTGLRLTMDPQSGLTEIQEFDKKYQQILDMIEKASAEEPEYIPYLELLKF